MEVQVQHVSEKEGQKATLTIGQLMTESGQRRAGDLRQVGKVRGHLEDGWRTTMQRPPRGGQKCPEALDFSLVDTTVFNHFVRMSLTSNSSDVLRIF